jgi:hypothetical protein
MRRRIQNFVARSVPVTLAILLAVPPLPRAQQAQPAQQPAPQAQQAAPTPAQQPAPTGQPGDNDVQPFKPEELEAIVAPIALYPDPLVAQVLMAATYPLEVIQAARLMKSKPNLKDQALNDELKKYEWDDSVKSLCSFPQTLDILNEKIDWMQKLGDAFLDQRKDTMDAIQRMRAKAQAQGNLKTNEQQKVIVEQVESAPPPPPPAGQPPAPPQPAEQTVIKIEPANPQVIYVPAYNPTVVYGSYPPAYPPYYPYPPAYPWGAAALSFGVGMAVGAAVWGGCNWGGGDVDIDVNKNNNFTNNVNRGDKATQIKNERGSGGQGGKDSFKHNPEHRGGAQYRDKGTQQKYNRASGPQAGTREASKGRGDQGGGRQDGGRGGGPSASTREGGGGAGQRGPSASTREGGAGGGGREAGAMQGMGQGGQTRADSQRGQSSVSSSRASGNSGGGSRGGGSSYSGGGGGGCRSGGGGGGGGGSRGGGGGGGGGGSRGGGRR